MSSRAPASDGGRRTGVWLALAVALSVGGCAASAALRQGRDAERRQDFDRAVVEYTRAVRLNPNNIDARVALERTKLRASQDHYARGRRLAAAAKLDEALVEYETAAELNPTNGDIEQELRATRNKLRAKIAVHQEGKTELQTLIERARDLAPPGLDLPQGVKMPATLTFRDASSRDVFVAISRLANISLIFDPLFRETPITVDLRNASLEDSLNTVAGATRTFFRVTAPKTVAVIPDTPAKRREYEEEVVRTFYLSNVDLKETMDLLRMVLDARRISPTTGTNALTIKDTPERIAAAGRVISAIDKARPEVIIDVELLEVDRTKLLEYGLQIASSGPAATAGVGLELAGVPHAIASNGTLVDRQPPVAVAPAVELAPDRRRRGRAGSPDARRAVARSRRSPGSRVSGWQRRPRRPGRSGHSHRHADHGSRHAGSERDRGRKTDPPRSAGPARPGTR